MPSRIDRDPFGGSHDDPPSTKLLAPEFRILKVLQPDDPADHWIEWPIRSRARLGEALGLTPISGTITRALNGVRPGGSNRPCPGLLALGYVEEVVLDIDGLREVNYRATIAGVRAYHAHRDTYGDPGPTRVAKKCTNKRYLKDTNDDDEQSPESPPTGG